MKESLETKLHNHLKAQTGNVPYEQIKDLVENIWLTPKGGHYRMETLTRRWRKDKYRPNDISDRIGRITKNGAIVSLYYKTDAIVSNPLIKPFISPTAQKFLATDWGKKVVKPVKQPLF